MKNNRYGIEKIEHFFPSTRISSVDLAETFDFDLNFIENKIGVKNLYMVSGEKTSDLAIKVLEQLFKAQPYLKDELDLLVICTQTPDYQLPQVSSQVQNRCGLGSNIAAFDISLGCSGFVYGLNVVEGFLERNQLRKGVLITAETYSSIIDPADRNTKCLFSDAATVTLISQNGRVYSGSFCFATNGDQFDDLIVRAPKKGATDKVLFMNGRGIFQYVMSRVPEDVEKVCRINGLGINDIDFFVFHQASKYVLDAVAKQIGLPGSSKIVNTLDVTGNTVSSSIPIALKQVLAKTKKRDLKILVSGFGVGLSRASTILTIQGECPDV